MSAVQTFESQEQAQAVVKKMRGWDARVVEITLPDPEDPTRPRNSWVIQIRGYGDPQYLRQDGYVK